jgi:UDP-N-acetylmuramate dehydrogenase
LTNLRQLNTLGLSARADDIITVSRPESLRIITEQIQDQPRIILGGGSNVVLHAPIKGVVLHNCILGRRISPAGLLTCGAGEDWHALVMWSLDQGYAGLENLALIPGTAGAAPVQNIGAYGVELSDRLTHIVAWDFTTAQFVEFSGEDCQFSYRNSIFKNPTIQGPWDQPRYFITEISLQLSPIDQAQLNTDYGELQSELKQFGQRISAREVAQAVIAIRRRKLPDPKILGNVGSFFKNPIISKLQAQNIALLHPDLPLYPLKNADESMCKISAGWLIDRCGFKGARRGDAGVHDQHALVLVNYGDASGREILALAQEIQQAVIARFGVYLDAEPIFMPPMA